MHSRLLSFQTISGLRTSLCLRALSPCRYACANRRSTRWRPCYAAGVEPKEVTVDQRIALCATVEPCRHRAVLHSFTSFQSPPPYPHLGTTTTGSLRFERRKTGYKEALGSSLVEGRQGSARESRRNRADSFVTTIQCSQRNQRTNVTSSKAHLGTAARALAATTATTWAGAGGRGRLCALLLVVELRPDDLGRVARSCQ